MRSGNEIVHLLFSDVAWPYISGPSIVLKNFRDYLKMRGIEEKTWGPNYVQYGTDENYFQVFSIPFFLPNYKIPIPLNYLKIIGFIRKVLHHPIIVHSFCPFFMGLIAKKISKQLNILHITWFSTDYFSLSKYYHLDIFTGCAKKYLTWFYRSADLIICPSEQTKSVVESLGLKTGYVVPSSIHIKDYIKKKSKTSFRSTFSIPKGSPLVLAVGRLSNEKNIDLIIKAVQKIEKAYLIVVGEGPERKSLEILKSKEIIFAGRVEHRDIPIYFANCDVFAFASELETMPLVLLEAWASGIPIVSYQFPGAENILTNGENALLVRRKSEFEFAKKINMILKDPILKRKLVFKGLVVVKKYDAQNVFDKLLSKTRAMIDSKKWKN